MRYIFSLICMIISFAGMTQEEGDTVYRRCPVSIKDTVTGNNYFIEHQPATVKTYRNKGDFTIVIEQKNQFFSLFFNSRKLKENGKYKIQIGGKNAIAAKYSFRSGDDAAYTDVSRGTVETIYDKVKNLWHIKVTGLIANMGGNTVSYFKAMADFYIK